MNGARQRAGKQIGNRGCSERCLVVLKGEGFVRKPKKDAFTATFWASFSAQITTL